MIRESPRSIHGARRSSPLLMDICMTSDRCYRLLIAYDGTEFCGWEKQAQGERTIRAVIESSLHQLTGENVSLVGAGRTDSGVHALGQVASLCMSKEMEEETLHRGLNALLPGDVRILEARRVPRDFHARISAKAKTYFYQILESRYDDPFRSRYFHRMASLPDTERIRSAAEVLLGEKDFAAMRAAGSDVPSSLRRVFAIKVRRGKDWVRIFFTADGFLYRMVRNMVSLIMAQARGEISREAAEGILASRDRRAAPPTFPGKGLFLWRVYY